MRNTYRLLLCLAINLLALTAFTQTPGEWTWIHGSDSLSRSGVWGTQGVPAAINRPPSVYEPASWKDLQGNFWIFGGFGSGTGPYSDMWRYNPTTNQWTWMKGPRSPNVTGTYGTQGVPAAGNNPGARKYTAATWVDKTGNLWLFGGNGLHGGSTGAFNDLWRYNIATNEWTWMKGLNGINQAGVYGTQGVSAPANTPGARQEANATWVDADGNLWLFGGEYNSAYYNDVWKYTISTNEWTWIKGANTTNPAAVYGTKGVANAANTPNGRGVYCKWKDQQGNFWIFGGNGPYRSATLSIDSYNDLWKYNPATNEWTWVSGTDTVNSLGNYGTKCAPADTNVPPARWKNQAAWMDAKGNFWIFGGTVYTGGSGLQRNDLWHYNLATNQWTWASGSNAYSQAGVYGTRGVSAPANMPGARYGAAAWTGNDNNLWLFGGSRNAGSNNFNDLWRFVPDTLCITTAGCIAAIAGNIVALRDTICKDEPASLTVAGSTGSLQWQWSADGISFANLPGDTAVVYNPVAVAQTTYYRIKASNNCGSDSSAIFKLQVNELAPPAVSATDTLICTSDSTLVTATGQYAAYLWNNGDIRPYTYAKAAGGYWVTVTGANGCTAISTREDIGVYPVPSVSITVRGDTLTSFGADSYQWYLNSTLIPGTNANTYIATQTGNYAVQVTDSNGCKASSSPVAVTITGLHEMGQEEWSLYPNPANEVLKVKFKPERHGGVILLYNSVGQLVLSTMLKDGQEINVRNLPDGIYSIKYQVGNTWGVQKIVVSHP